MNPHHAIILDESLVLGNVRGARDRELIAQLGATAVVNLILYNKDEDPRKDKPDGVVEWLHAPVDDRPLTNLDWAERVAAWMEERIAEKRVVYVHCSQGVSRAPSACIYFLMTRHGFSLRRAYDHVRERRPVICPSIGFFEGMCDVERARGAPETFSRRDYSIQCAQEIFPLVPADVVERAWDEAVTANPTTGDGNVDPIGYLLIDNLMRAYKDKYVKRFGASLHHPFD